MAKCVTALCNEPAILHLVTGSDPVNAPIAYGGASWCPKHAPVSQAAIEATLIVR